MTHPAQPLARTPLVLTHFTTHLAGPERDRRLGLAAGAVSPAAWNEAIDDPVRAFLGVPGKSLRTNLIELGWSIAGGRGAPPDTIGVIIELLHAGSLIVDDVEDGASERRGQPSLHVSHGLARALNTGNTLYFCAEELLANLRLSPMDELDARRAFSRTLFRAHHGQALDVSVPITTVPRHETAALVESVTRLKTGALVELAMRLVALSADASPPVSRALERFGAELGTALQALDDLSGVVSRERREKGREDLIGRRPTWPFGWAASLLDDEAYDALTADVDRAVERGDVDEVQARLGELVERRGRSDVHARLERALFVVGPFTDVSLGARVRRLVDLLEHSYGT